MGFTLTPALGWVFLWSQRELTYPQESLTLTMNFPLDEWSPLKWKGTLQRETGMKRHDLVRIFKLFITKEKSPLGSWIQIGVPLLKGGKPKTMWSYGRFQEVLSIVTFNLYDITLKMFLFPCMKAPSSRKFTQTSFPSNWWESCFPLEASPRQAVLHPPESSWARGPLGPSDPLLELQSCAPHGESAALQCLGKNCWVVFLIKQHTLVPN